ncbi:MAG: CAP domain-containing protein [Chloroflexaceae bacterium]|nr:CAP domain-containing protein [Chloroflexaceae bacterium]
MDLEPSQPASTPTSAPSPVLPTSTPGTSSTATATPTAVSLPTDTPLASFTATPTPTVLPTSTPVPYAPGVCLTAEETELARLINEHRHNHGLPDAPLSRSLSYVAQVHVRDLEDHRPHQATDESGQQCNMHSWSDQGNWTPVCYTPDHKNASGMWEKPGELTDYPGRGYENSYSHSLRATAEGAITGWKNSPAHNAVIIEEGIWAGKNWQAMGIGIYGKYAVVWFGEEPDSEGTIPPCP